MCIGARLSRKVLSHVASFRQSSPYFWHWARSRRSAACIGLSCFSFHFFSNNWGTFIQGFYHSISPALMKLSNLRISVWTLVCIIYASSCHATHMHFLKRLLFFESRGYVCPGINGRREWERERENQKSSVEPLSLQLDGVINLSYPFRGQIWGISGLAPDLTSW